MYIYIVIKLKGDTLLADVFVWLFAFLVFRYFIYLVIEANAPPTWLVKSVLPRA